MTHGLSWRIGLLVVSFVTYYWWVKAGLYASCRGLARRLPAVRRYSQSEVGGVLELGAAAFSHVVFVVVLLLVTGLSLADAGFGRTPVVLLALGAAVGIGEFALSEFACRISVEALIAWPRVRTSARAFAGARSAAVDAVGAGRPSTVEGWLGLGRGGWIRHHLQNLELLPLPVALTVLTAQVASEETVFRGVYVGYLRPYGAAVAIGSALTLFVAMQAIFMPTWRAALFPVVGGLVMGVVHSVLFWQVPLIAPLVVAHVSFFLFAVV